MADIKKFSEVRYSIIITCYNQCKFIKDAVESALCQPYLSKEVILVDDKSDDDSLSMLRVYEREITVLELQTNGGPGIARNRGAAIARGEYLLFLDGDDILAPWALAVYEKLISARHPTTVVGGARWFNGSVPVVLAREIGNKVKFVEYESLMAKDRGIGLYNGAFLIDRQSFVEVGGWSPDIYALDGHDLFGKLGYSGRSILVCSPYTMFYRMHAGNSIHHVPPFVQSAHVIINRERAGKYPGGEKKRFERYARHGGTIAFCAKKAFRAGFYAQALSLLRHGWSMVLFASLRKGQVWWCGRAPIETLDLGHRFPGQESSQ